MKKKIVSVMILTTLSLGLMGCDTTSNVRTQSRFASDGLIVTDTKTGVEYYCNSYGITTPLYNADGTLCINEKYKPKDNQEIRHNNLKIK